MDKPSGSGSWIAGLRLRKFWRRCGTGPRPCLIWWGRLGVELNQTEKAFGDLPSKKARESVKVKLLPQTGELYILARSTGRMAKERSIRKRRLKQLWRRLAELQRQKLTRDELLLKLGAAKGKVILGSSARIAQKHDFVKLSHYSFLL